MKADVTGHIQVKAHLSGIPECKFGLNDSLLLSSDDGDPRMNHTAAAGAVNLEDCQFHQCVKLGKFDSDRIISFIPPDGEFELMKYRAVDNINLPFKVIAQVTEIGQMKVDFEVTVKATYGQKLTATDVIIRIPTPLNTSDTKQDCTNGKVKYDPSENQLVWK